MLEAGGCCQLSMSYDQYRQATSRSAHGLGQRNSNHEADDMPRLNPLLVRDNTTSEGITFHRVRVNELEGLSM